MCSASQWPFTWEGLCYRAAYQSRKYQSCLGFRSGRYINSVPNYLQYWKWQFVLQLNRVKDGSVQETVICAILRQMEKHGLNFLNLHFLSSFYGCSNSHENLGLFHNKTEFYKTHPQRIIWVQTILHRKTVEPASAKSDQKLKFKKPLYD